MEKSEPFEGSSLCRKCLDKPVHLQLAGAISCQKMPKKGWKRCFPECFHSAQHQQHTSDWAGRRKSVRQELWEQHPVWNNHHWEKEGSIQGHEGKEVAPSTEATLPRALTQHLPEELLLQGICRPKSQTGVSGT